jgi:hypothetical protein
MSGVGAGNGHTSPVDRKGKARAVEPSIASESTLPSKIYINHPNPPTRRNTSTRATLDTVLSYLPVSIQKQIVSLYTRRWSPLAIPLPVIALILGVIAIRRRVRRGRTAIVDGAVAGGGVLAVDAVNIVRDRLRRARERGLLQWFGWWVRWWIQKVIGVWRLGTTITYV